MQAENRPQVGAAASRRESPLGGPAGVGNGDAHAQASLLVEAWHAPETFLAMGQQVLDRAKACLTIRIASGIDMVSVSASPSISIRVLASPCAKPHVDAGFPEWSALWILQSCGHVLGIADHRPADPLNTTRRPLKSPHLTFVPLDLGRLVIFNAHRTHWMDAAPGKPRPVMFAASFNFETRPSRKMVEDQVRTPGPTDPSE